MYTSQLKNLLGIQKAKSFVQNIFSLFSKKTTKDEGEITSIAQMM